MAYPEKPQPDDWPAIQREIDAALAAIRDPLDLRAAYTGARLLQNIFDWYSREVGPIRDDLADAIYKAEGRRLRPVARILGISPTRLKQIRDAREAKEGGLSA